MSDLLPQPIIDIQHVSVHYDKHLALDKISFFLYPGERVALIGPNGAGKSTLFKTIIGLLKPSQGQVILSQQRARHQIAYIPQRSQIDWRFPATVADMVMMGRAGQIGLFRRPSRRDWVKVEAALEQVGMEALANRQIGELSGGQQQRIFIARALVQEATLLLLDEPLTGLDVHSQERILSLLDSLQAEGIAVLLSTHDLNLAATCFDRLLILNQRLLGCGPPEQVFKPNVLSQAYGGQLPILQLSPTTRENVFAKLVSQPLTREPQCIGQGSIHWTETRPRDGGFNG